MKMSWNRPRFIPILASQVVARLRKVDALFRFAKVSSSDPAFRMLDSKRPRVFTRVPAPLLSSPLLAQYFSNRSLVCKPSHHSQQTRSIDFDDLDRKKSTGRAEHLHGVS